MKLSEQIRAIGFSDHGAEYVAGVMHGIEQAAQLAEAHELTWTKTLPTVVGWYWTRIPEIGYSERVVRVYSQDGRMFSSYVAVTSLDGFEWAGPINTPAEGGAS